jgi:hypothetical protein
MSRNGEVIAKNKNFTVRKKAFHMECHPKLAANKSTVLSH